MWLHRLHGHVCAIARADDAAGDIACACVYPPCYTASCAHDTFVYRCKILGYTYVSTLLRRRCMHMQSRARADNTAYPRRNVRALPVGIDRVWLGSQAFYSASAFNANIGAWNTVAVANMYQVCARPLFDVAPVSVP